MSYCSNFGLMTAHLQKPENAAVTWVCRDLCDAKVRNRQNKVKRCSFSNLTLPNRQETWVSGTFSSISRTSRLVLRRSGRNYCVQYLPCSLLRSALCPCWHPNCNFRIKVFVEHQVSTDGVEYIHGSQSRSEHPNWQTR